jgi:hypothetical protein
MLDLDEHPFRVDMAHNGVSNMAKPSNLPYRIIWIDDHHFRLRPFDQDDWDATLDVVGHVAAGRIIDTTFQGSIGGDIYEVTY